MKVCIKCKEEKEFTNFYKREHYKNGIAARCKDCVKQCQKQFRENNKEYYSNYNKDYAKNRKLRDPLFKLKMKIKDSIRKSIKRKFFTKKQSTCKYLGCSILEFKLHIEKQFTKGMVWDNHGKWHFDHIYPISLAKDEAELIKLNHYTNFQPLWAIDNLKKGNKIIEKQLILI